MQGSSKSKLPVGFLQDVMGARFVMILHPHTASTMLSDMQASVQQALSSAL